MSPIQPLTVIKNMIETNGPTTAQTGHYDDIINELFSIFEEFPEPGKREEKVTELRTKTVAIDGLLTDVQWAEVLAEAQTRWRTKDRTPELTAEQLREFYQRNTGGAFPAKAHDVGRDVDESPAASLACLRADHDLRPLVVQMAIFPKKVRKFVLRAQTAECANRQKRNKHTIGIKSTLQEAADVANGVYAYLLPLPHRQVKPISRTRRYPTLSYRFLEHRSKSFDLGVTVTWSDARKRGLEILGRDIHSGVSRRSLTVRRQ